jgi:hypothetical protein
MEGYIFVTAIKNWRTDPLEKNKLISRILTVLVILPERDRTLQKLALYLCAWHPGVQKS